MPKKKVNVCVFTNYYPPIRGGAQIALFEVTRRLARRGYNIHVITRKFPGLKEEEYMYGVHVYRVPFLKIPYLIHMVFLLTGFLKGLDVLCKEDIDIIHAFQVYPGAPLAALLKKVSGKPTILTVQGVGMTEHIYQRGIRRILLWGLKNVDEITAVCPYLKNKVLELGINSKKVSVIYHGSDSQIFKPLNSPEIRSQYLSKNEKLLVTVGLLHPIKGVAYLIRAMKILEEDNLKLVIVGDGPQRKELEELTKRLGLNEHIIFTGYLPHRDVVKYISAADLFVLPSLLEGLPKTLVEASFCGVPIVSTDCEGPKDFIMSAKNGIIVPKADPHQLAYGIKKILENHPLYEEMKNNSVRVRDSGKYDWETSIDKYINLYNRVLQKIS